MKTLLLLYAFVALIAAGILIGSNMTGDSAQHLFTILIFSPLIIAAIIALLMYGGQSMAIFKARKKL